MNRRRFLASVALGVGFLSGCGGSGGDDPTPSPTEAASPTPMSTAESDTRSQTDGAETASDTSTDADGTTATQTGPSTATDQSTITGTPTETTATPTARDEYPDYDWQQLEDVDPVTTSTVTMRDFAFEPLIVAIGPGSDLTVRNEDGYVHTITVPGLGIDERVPAGGTVSMTLDSPGTFGYVCTFHPPNMLGQIRVTDDTP